MENGLKMQAPPSDNEEKAVYALCMAGKQALHCRNGRGIRSLSCRVHLRDSATGRAEFESLCGCLERVNGNNNEKRLPLPVWLCSLMVEP
jgi:hypothetical protein